MEAGVDKRGLALAQELYEQRDRRAKDLKKEGKKVVGYMCSLFPLEFLTAGDLIPFRIMGNIHERVEQAEAYIEPHLCPYVRNCFEQGLKGKYDFLDGVVMCHTCDSVQRVYGLWRYYLKPTSSLVNTPHTTGPSARRFYKEELVILKEWLESLAEKAITEEEIRRAIRLHNENRALVRELYDLRKEDPPRLSGAEMLRLLVVGMSVPAPEFQVLLKQVREEALARTGRPAGRARLLVYGSIIDDATLIQLVEESGADVVVDDTCIGSRSFWHDVDEVEDPLEGLVNPYFAHFRCPRTYRGSGPERFRYLVNMARAFRVQGVVAYTLKFCDPHMLDFPSLRDYLQQAELPTLYLEDDYTFGNVGQMRTRVQAFLELLAGRP